MYDLEVLLVHHNLHYQPFSKPLYNHLYVDSLLRGDFKTRTEGYKTLALVGALNVNEIRALENMNSIGDAGDKYYVQLNMTESKDLPQGGKE